MQKKIVSKVAGLTFDLRYISDLAISTPGCLRADLGELNYPVSPLVRETIHELSGEASFDYAPTFGHPKLLEALQVFEKDTLQAFEDPKILVTSGGQAALFASFVSLINPGEGILTDTYYYPPYAGIAKIVEATFVQHDFDVLSTFTEPHKIKLILLNSPNNPTGRVYEAGILREIAHLARKYDWIILEDRVYDHIYFGEKPISISHLCPERTLVINSASKNFCMPGIRIGWLYGPADLVINITKTHRNMNSCPNSFFQKVLAQFVPASQSYFSGLRSEMSLRRDAILEVFDDLGWDYLTPDGAIYAMAQVPGLRDSLDFVERMIRKGNVSAMPGTFFGNHPDELRFCFGALQLEQIHELHNRLKTIV